MLAPLTVQNIKLYKINEGMGSLTAPWPRQIHPSVLQKCMFRGPKTVFFAAEWVGSNWGRCFKFYDPMDCPRLVRSSSKSRCEGLRKHARFKTSEADLFPQRSREEWVGVPYFLIFTTMASLKAFIGTKDNKETTFLNYHNQYLVKSISIAGVMSKLNQGRPSVQALIIS